MINPFTRRFDVAVAPNVCKRVNAFYYCCRHRGKIRASFIPVLASVVRQ